MIYFMDGCRRIISHAEPAQIRYAAFRCWAVAKSIKTPCPFIDLTVYFMDGCRRIRLKQDMAPGQHLCERNSLGV